MKTEKTAVTNNKLGLMISNYDQVIQLSLASM